MVKKIGESENPDVHLRDERTLYPLPPMTKFPQGLMWYLVSLVMYCLGMTARITWG